MHFHYYFHMHKPCEFYYPFNFHKSLRITEKFLLRSDFIFHNVMKICFVEAFLFSILGVLCMFNTFITST